MTFSTPNSRWGYMLSPATRSGPLINSLHKLDKLSRLAKLTITMLAKETIDFLKKLEKNNNRDWFNENKGLFQRANDNVIALTGELIGCISKFDPAVASIDPKTCVFRIYRDVRFSKDKSPYKTNLGAFIAPGGKKAMLPGYYFHLQPGMFFAAAGKHMPDAAELLKIRKAIVANTSEFLKI